MKEISSELLITGLQQEVEEVLALSVSIFQNLDEAILMRASASGGWSIAQCLEHLNSYSRFYHPAIQHAMITKKFKGTYFTSSWLGNFFTNMMDASNTRKYPALKAHVPGSGIDAYEVVASFIKHQETLLDLLEKARYSDLVRVKVPLSVTPFLTLRLGDVFRFIVAHTQRHMQQARRNL